MRVLITGGAGFIGSHLSEFHVTRGDQVICVDNFYTGSKQNIQHLSNYSNFEILQHDVTSPLYLEVDRIYNLACPASPIHYQSDPVQTTKTCVLGAVNMLELANKTRARIFQASTSEIYGDPERHPQTEEYWGNVNPIGIRSCYDEGKRCAETLFFDYERQYNVDVRVARIFNTYGPRMHPNDGRVVSNFIVQALLGEKITIYGSGQQTRSFCFVDDLVKAILAFMNKDLACVGPINLGNSNEFSVLQLAELILKLTNSESKIEFQELPQDDPKQRKPDISKATTTLEWFPVVEIEEGLLRTIQYFRSLNLKSMVFK
jgi:UDP-glucuronate decarboxylase